MASQGWPENVGVIAMEVYFPYQYVDQSELEVFDGVGQGKYTIGLGQSRMGFCSDREDINSLCLTVVERLVQRNGISYDQIGRLEVGTETIIDKSKSVKTVLMQLFEKSGNTNVEGVDTTNACYGGTNALFNALNWIESSSWDGRLAIVVAADIAVYATGSARPTGGAGAVAMLVGPKAALIIERGLRATHMRHAYDFYKPDLSSEYPTVDGKLSIECYLSALDNCYKVFRERADSNRNPVKNGHRFSLSSADAFLFHTPYCKLVQKSLARLCFNDFLSKPDDFSDSTLQKYRDSKLEATYFDRDIEGAFMKQSKELYEHKTLPYLWLSNQVGNMYTPSLYGGLVSFIARHKVEELKGRRAVLFSYGSGLASSMFSMRVTDDLTVLGKLSRGVADLGQRLDSRLKVEPSEFAATMKLREDTHHLAPYTPSGDVTRLFPGTWYLKNIDDKHRRFYERTPL